MTRPLAILAAALTSAIALLWWLRRGTEDEDEMQVVQPPDAPRPYCTECHACGYKHDYFGPCPFPSIRTRY